MILLQDLCCVIGVAEFDFDVVNGKNIIKPKPTLYQMVNEYQHHYTFALGKHIWKILEKDIQLLISKLAKKKLSSTN